MNLHTFLDNESAFGRLMTRCGIVIVANVLFVLTTIPLVTIGAGWTGMYHTLLRTLRGDGVVNPFKEFWKGFKNNFKQATLVWIVILLLGGFLYLDWFWCGQLGGVFETVKMGVFAIAVAVAIIGVYIFPTMTAFEATIPELIRNSLFFAFKKPLNLVVIMFFNVFPMFLTFNDLHSLPLYAFIWCFFGFGAVGLLTSYLLLGEFKPYLPMVDICGDIIVNPEDEALWADSPDAEGISAPAGGVPQKSEEEILEEMLKLGM